MVEHQPDTSRGSGLSVRDQPHFPFEFECLFEYSDEFGLPPSQMYVMSADACSVAEQSFVKHSGHFIQRDDPQAIVDVIEAMVMAA